MWGLLGFSVEYPWFFSFWLFVFASYMIENQKEKPQVYLVGNPNWLFTIGSIPSSGSRYGRLAESCVISETRQEVKSTWLWSPSKIHYHHHHTQD